MKKFGEVSTDNRIYDMYQDYRADGMSHEDAVLATARNTEYDYEAVEGVLRSYGIHEEKIMNGGETITIQEDVRIPGTDIVLEKGDRIQIEESMFSSTIMDDIKEYMVNSIIDKADPYRSGMAFISELDTAIGDQLDDDTIIDFYRGLAKGLVSLA